MTCVATLLPILLTRPAANARQGSPPGFPGEVPDLQRSYNMARDRRQPVTHLLADAFVQIQADGTVLTRAEAVANHVRYYDGSAGSLVQTPTAAYGDVAIVAGFGGQEGTPYLARRVSVWIQERGVWRLLVVHKTFVRERGAKLQPFALSWPAVKEHRDEQPVLSDEQTFATRDPALLDDLVSDDAILVDGYGEQFTGRAWVTQLAQASDGPSELRNLTILHRGLATVIVGSESSTKTGLMSRFTRVWTRAPHGGMQLQMSQATVCASEVFGPAHR